MAQYRKKPVVIEAIRWDGLNFAEVINFLGNDLASTADEMIGDGEMYIATLEGRMHASHGDYIIRGVNGEHYACKPDIFEKTYEAV